MAKIPKNFRLSSTAVECIELLKENEKYTETEVVEQALLNYVLRVFGQEKLNELILRTPHQDEE